MSTRDVLFELGTEELPAKSLTQLSQALAANIQAGLKKAELSHGEVRIFATPRRLAVIIKQLQGVQKNQLLEKRGPALKAAFDNGGNPTLACLGFASACGTTVDQLVTRETDKGAWVFFYQEQGGMDSAQLLPELIKQAIAQLAIAKPMRWGDHEVEFIRPIHWAVLLLGKKALKTDIFGILTGRSTFGHRFHHPKTISIAHPNDYETLLREQGYVLADFAVRRQYIKDSVQKVAAGKGQALLDDALLDEVTGLVEWPVALLGEFEPEFLQVPAEAVMTAMKSHQKYFPVLDEENQLLPYFVVVSNIASQQPQRVIAGNERVIRARLADAQFFYHSDLKHSLESRLASLEKVIFQQKLGSLLDKSQRVSALAGYLAEKMQGNAKHASRAGLLCKADLVTAMVGEFAELQGIMGYHYAVKDGEPAAVALALREHYQPRFAGDALPETPVGAWVSIADKVDTLVGLFGANQPPTGERDPYGLRRAALGVLRIIIEKQWPLNLIEIIARSKELYADQLDNQDTVLQLFHFMMERLRTWYLDKGVDPAVFAAVLAKGIPEPLDFHRRVEAVQHFLTLTQAHALIAANKRVSHLVKDIKSIEGDRGIVPRLTEGLSRLEKYGNHQTPVEYMQSPDYPVDPLLFQHEAEHILFAALRAKSLEVEPLYHAAKYSEALTALAALQAPTNHFFDQVMVMVEDETLRNNRLALLYQLRKLFLDVADIALLAPATDSKN